MNLNVQSQICVSTKIEILDLFLHVPSKYWLFLTPKMTDLPIMTILCVCENPDYMTHLIVRRNGPAP